MTSNVYRVNIEVFHSKWHNRETVVKREYMDYGKGMNGDGSRGQITLEDSV